MEKSFRESFLISSGKTFRAFLDQIQGKETKREAEDYNRYVFKRCLAQMLKEFASKNEKIKKRNMEKRFYEHYFSKIAKEKGIKLEHFYKPKPGNEKDNEVPRSFNQTYIKNICSNPDFKKELLDYLNNGLLENEKQCLEKKLNWFVNVWQEIIEKAECKETAAKEICMDVGVSRKGMKYLLPWTIFEVKDAIEKVRRRFERYSEAINY